MDNCRGLDLGVARIHLDQTVSMARPCDVCMAVIKRVGIRNVYYTDWEGKWVCERVSNS